MFKTTSDGKTWIIFNNAFYKIDKSSFTTTPYSINIYGQRMFIFVIDYKIC